MNKHNDLPPRLQGENGARNLLSECLINLNPEINYSLIEDIKKVLNNEPSTSNTIICENFNF